MAEYLLYCFDGYRLTRCERFDAPADAAALDQAIRLRGAEAAELWCGSRKVKQFEKESSAE